MKLTFDLQRRDPKKGRAVVSRKTFDTARLGVVIVDMWNWHWCTTVIERAGALVPRMNRALEGLRAMGVRVFHCPTDIADNYVGTPMRERALATRPHVPPDNGREWPPPVGDYGCGCMCGPGFECPPKLGWDAIDPHLVMLDADYVAKGTQELHSLCQELGLTTLLYFGIATNACLIGKPTGMMPMARTGMETILARDLTDAQTEYDPARPFTPDDGTAAVVAHLERSFCRTVNIADELRKAGRWNDDWLTEPVRFAPWGVPHRPHEFDKPFTLTMSVPWIDGSELRYTTDGAEPTPTSKRYTKPIRITNTATVRAAAFRDGRRVSLESEGCFAKLLPMPPKPDVHVSDLTPFRWQWSFYDMDHPRLNKSFACTRLKLKGRWFDKGVGVRAPSHVVYELTPDYDRFVALAGLNVVDFWDVKGEDVARYPSVVFRVFIDGELVQESPVMRITSEPWRFDVPLPRGARLISLAVTDAGDGFREDYANWVDAGFVRKQ